MTAALKQFDLRRQNLFAHTVAKDGHWEYSRPTIRCASYDCQGVFTRLFFRDDVANLARKVHGDLEVHMKVREESRRKLAEKRRQNRLLSQAQ